MTKKKEKNKLIKWFIDEGALTQENNLYIGDRIFQANSFVNWIRENSVGKTLDKEEIEQNMLIVRMFLQKKVNLKWKNGIIDVVWNNNSSTDLDRAASEYGSTSE